MKRLYALVAILLPLTTLAHSGHGHFPGHSPAHYFSSPLHLTALAAAIVLAMIGLVIWKRKRAPTENS